MSILYEICSLAGTKFNINSPCTVHYPSHFFPDEQISHDIVLISFWAFASRFASCWHLRWLRGHSILPSISLSHCNEPITPSPKLFTGDLAVTDYDIRGFVLGISVLYQWIPSGLSNAWKCIGLSMVLAPKGSYPDSGLLSRRRYVHYCDERRR
jgi:hypothetical protein